MNRRDFEKKSKLLSFFPHEKETSQLSNNYSYIFSYRCFSISSDHEVIII